VRGVKPVSSSVYLSQNFEKWKNDNALDRTMNIDILAKS
jgi:hypothetical protein